MNKRSLFVSLPGKPRCGVADYSSKLYSEYRRIYGDVAVEYGSQDFSWFSLLFKSFNYDVVVFQYPATFYRLSLMPVLYLSLVRLCGCRVVLVVHEYSQVSMLRKFFTRLLMFLSNKIVFTNHFEKSGGGFVCSSKYEVIPIGSNILPKQGFLRTESNNRLVFFGLIREKKGFEEFVGLCEENKHSNLFDPVLIGSVSDEALWCKYYSRLLLAGVEVHINKSESEVSDVLMSCSYAYLFYPDGASSRRGSLLASLAHGLIVFSNRGDHTDQSLIKVIRSVSFEDVVKDIDRLKYNNEEYKQEVRRSMDYYKSFSWGDIAEKFHLVINY